ncbi:MAG: right-handed parallel beta-helix repeat-containing protein, partial [Elusimicrobia bacterium]|nr:right-handed parallel beta-helix repeat-containing protein [Elusimicrobiota bacterium]
FSTITSQAGTAIFLRASSTSSIISSYVQGSTAIHISGSTGTVIGDSILIGTSALGAGLWVSNASQNLTLSSSTLRAGPLGRALKLDRDNIGAITLSSISLQGSLWGLVIDTQAAGATLSIASATFRDLQSGATAMHFLGGVHISTFADTYYDDSAAINVNGTALDAGSRVTMSCYRGPRGGPSFETDPSNQVDWVPCPAITLPPECASGFNVRKTGGDHDTIQAALNALPDSLSGLACVVIRDSETYSEAVMVEGFSGSGGYTGALLKIMADPTFVSSAPAINPPTASTAAFQIINSSVAIEHVNIITTNTVAYGVSASSAYITISSVNVDSNGNIWSRGLSISSHSVIAYSSVTISNAQGIRVTGLLSAVRYSTSTASGTGSALVLNLASTSTVEYGMFTAANGNAISLTSSDFNEIRDSTATISDGSYSHSAVALNWSNNNTLRSSYLQGTLAYSSLMIINSSRYNTVLQSTVSAASSSYNIYVQGSSSNTVDQSRLTHPGGTTINLDWGSSYNTVIRSTMSSSSGSAYRVGNNTGNWYNTLSQSYISNTGHGVELLNGLNTISASTVNSSLSGYAALAITGSSSNTIADSYFSNSNGYGAYIISYSSNNFITRSRLIGGSSNPGLYLSGSSSNTIDRSFVINSGSTAAWLSESSNNTILLSTISGGPNLPALYLTGSSSNTFSSNVILSTSGVGLFMASYSSYNLVSLSTVSTANNTYSALRLLNASSNTLSELMIRNDWGTALSLAYSSHNTIALSTITSQSTSLAALTVTGSSNTFQQIYVFNAALAAAGFYQSDYNSIIASTFMAGAGSGGYVLALNLSPWNSIERSRIIATAGSTGLSLYNNAHYNIIRDSSLTSNAAGGGSGALNIFLSWNNRFYGGSIRNNAGQALHISDSAGNQIDGSTITSPAANHRAVLIIHGSSNTILNSYIAGSTAVHVAASTGNAIVASVLVATNPLGGGLWISSGSFNFSLSSSSIMGGSQATAVRLDYGNSGAISLSSVVYYGSLYGLFIDTQTASATLSISSATFRDLQSGATAIHFLGGVHISTFADTYFDATADVNVNGTALDAGSRVTMSCYRGPRGGPAFETDPSNQVDWVPCGGQLPAGCALGF